VDFDSVDGYQTHLFFLLVAPENSPGDHLKALARISRILQDADFRARLMQASSAAELFSAIQAEDEKV
jgi:PTS system nitrogen regulatory IIA component